MAGAGMVEAGANAFGGLGRMSPWRQGVLLVALSASIALGVAVALWSRTPDYAMLYASIGAGDAAAAGEALDRAGIPYRIDPRSGALLVPSERVHEARLKLAGEGLPRSSDGGFELLDREQSFGTSQFLERARYQHALEVELARSIGSLNNVRSARVHLAVPRQSAFARSQRHASASVLVDLYAGRSLDDGQPDAIAHLVASAVPGLEVDAVRVVDQKGHLLTRPDSDTPGAPSREAFEYRRSLEAAYARRVEQIVEPIVGHDRVRAEVTAEVDLARSEQASEVFNPDLTALRSEQVVEDGTGTTTGGVPGALSNQPSAATAAPEKGAAGATPGGAPAAAKPVTGHREATRNYEVDRTVRHLRTPAGTLRRLSIAVVVDDHRETTGEGKVVTRARSPEEIAQIATLVKEAVGFDAARGDSVNVISAPFSVPAAVEPLPEPPIWERPWVWSVARQAGGALLVLLIAFGVLRPLMKNLVARDLAERRGSADGQGAIAGGDVADDRLSLSGRGPRRALADHGEQTDAVRALVGQDPRRVANVIKHWVNNDG